MHNTHPLYRPDIDGLRAVAILCVVIFHAFPGELSGGFIGVDVFFVISGFLISSVIYGSLAQGRFSFGDFYARRVRRIFPALILVLVAAYCTGWFVLMADEFKQFGAHIAASASFIQNFVLNQEAGYFDSASELKPLLHIWSLSIEEQYYLVFPFLVWVVWRVGLNALSVIGLLAVVSFALNISATGNSMSPAFYMPQNRIWELLAGALLAYFQLFKATSLLHALKSAVFHSLVFRFPPETERHDAVLNDLLATVGFSLIVAAAFGLDSTMAYPSGWALLPVVGSVFLILAGPAAWINQHLLNNRLMVQIGLISYPLYLWHWPILSFARIMGIGNQNYRVASLAVAASFFAAWLTYRLIERPLQAGGNQRLTTFILVLLMVIVGCAGYTTYERDGLSFRKYAFPTIFEGDVGHSAFFRYMSERYYPCTPAQIEQEALKWVGYTRCYQSKENDNIDMVLVGDSHAEQLFIGLAEQLPTKNIAYYIKDGSPFIDNPDFANIYKIVTARASIKKIVLTMSWSKRRADFDENKTLEKQLTKTVSALIAAGKEVYLTDDNPTFPIDPKNCKINRSLLLESNCAVDFSTAGVALAQYSDELLEVVRKEPRIKYLRTYRYFCNAEECSMLHGSKLLFRDKNHLNIEGSKYVAQRIIADYPSLK